jgi:hypothetical protein
MTVSLLTFERQSSLPDTTLVMEKIFVHDVRDEGALETLITWYDQHSAMAMYVRKEIMKLYRSRRSDSLYKVPLTGTWSDEVALPLIGIVCNRPVEVTGSVGKK